MLVREAGSTDRANAEDFEKRSPNTRARHRLRLSVGAHRVVPRSERRHPLEAARLALDVGVEAAGEREVVQLAGLAVGLRYPDHRERGGILVRQWPKQDAVH